MFKKTFLEWLLLALCILLFYVFLECNIYKLEHLKFWVIQFVSFLFRKVWLYPVFRTRHMINKLNCIYTPLYFMFFKCLVKHYKTFCKKIKKNLKSDSKNNIKSKEYEPTFNFFLQITKISFKINKNIIIA